MLIARQVSHLLFLFLFLILVKKDNKYTAYPLFKTMDSQFLMAMFLPVAFPPIVREEINPVIAALSSTLSRSGLMIRILKTRVAPIAPLKIPQISPITSLQKLPTLSAFFSSPIASAAPLIFLDAMLFKGASEHAVTATPIMSNKTPIEVIIIRIINVVIILVLIITVSEMKLTVIARKKLQKMMAMIQFLIFPLDFFNLPKYGSSAKEMAIQ